jgi:cytoplasmic iron level regulating protein YaaA (DUF328/UPF0246 family)
MYGYQLTQRAKELTKGELEMTEGALYPLLHKLENEQVFSPEIQKRMVRVLFVEEKNGKRKIHSTISKKGRGRFLSWMAETNCVTLEQLKEARVDGFQFDAMASTDRQLCFVRKV